MNGDNNMISKTCAGVSSLAH